MAEFSAGISEETRRSISIALSLAIAALPGVIIIGMYRGRVKTSRKLFDRIKEMSLGDWLKLGLLSHVKDQISENLLDVAKDSKRLSKESRSQDFFFAAALGLMALFGAVGGLWAIATGKLSPWFLFLPIASLLGSVYSVLTMIAFKMSFHIEGQDEVKTESAEKDESTAEEVTSIGVSGKTVLWHKKLDEEGEENSYTELEKINRHYTELEAALSSNASRAQEAKNRYETLFSSLEKLVEEDSWRLLIEAKDSTYNSGEVQDTFNMLGVEEWRFSKSSRRGSDSRRKLREIREALVTVDEQLQEEIYEIKKGEQEQDYR